METTRAVVLLHGMFGNAGNWRSCEEFLSPEWPVCTPELPVFELPRHQPIVEGLVDHVRRLMDEQGIGQAVIAGNSLGGHVALQFALHDPHRVAGLVLAGSSGLLEPGFERKVPRHPSRDWLRAKARDVFYDGKHVTEDLLDEMSETILDPRRVLQILRVAKSAKRENLRDSLHRITCPVLIVWGADDRITPPSVATEFMERLPNSELRFIPRCGHAAMIERPDEFNPLVADFLRQFRNPPRPA